MKYGHLNRFSAFRFENFIGKITKFVRKSENPLQQISRRLSEFNDILYKSISPFQQNFCNFETRHHNGPLDDCRDYTVQYKIMRTQSYYINCDDEANSTCLLKGGTAVEVLNFAVHDDVKYVIGLQLHITDDLYTYPTESRGFAIVVGEKSHVIQSWRCDMIIMKLMKLLYNNKLIIFPILHTIV